MPESRFTLTIEAENLAKEAFRSFQADALTGAHSPLRVRNRR